MKNNNKYKVLVVDDVLQNIQVVSNILYRENVSIFLARNGEQGLIQAEKNQPDLILLDIAMPDMDGYDVCLRLKENARTKHIPVIFLTARSQSEDMLRGFEVGGVDYITKPFNPEELLSRVFTHIELKRSKEALVESNATKDKLFSIIAHDLRNPFNNIIGFSELLKKNAHKYSPQKQADISTLINKSATQAHSLLENLLLWSRSQRGLLKAEILNLSLTHILEHVEQQTSTMAVAKRIKIEVLPEADYTIASDVSLLTTILRNLVTNAIKFTPQGGKITLSAQLQPQGTLISVADTGIGMSSETINNLFSIESNTTEGTDHEQGTGLGLVICREFVELLGGSLWAESVEGIGSTFYVLHP